MTKILTAPHPLLWQPSQKVKTLNKKILKIIKDLKQTLKAQENPQGVGLAACQISHPLRIFITKSTPKSSFSVFINPEITWKSKELTEGVPDRPNPLEGCLSLPGLWGKVARHKSLKLRYQTQDGQIRHQKFQGFLATIIQHEIDHLGGRLFPQRVLEQKEKLYKIVGKDKEGKEIFEEVNLTT